MDKVRLPKEVSDAIDKLKNFDGHTNERIIRFVFDPKSNASFKLNEYAASGHFEDILAALVNGYEVEETPEDKVSKAYKEAKRNKQNVTAEIDESFWSGWVSGMEEVVRLLDIKIEGVNA